MHSERAACQCGTAFCVSEYLCFEYWLDMVPIRSTQGIARAIDCQCADDSDDDSGLNACTMACSTSRFQHKH
jgi:hypothetical protein